MLPRVALGLIEHADCLIARYRWELVQELLKGLTGREILEESVNGYTRSSEDRSPPCNVR